MNLMRIGNRIINLDLVQSITYEPHRVLGMAAVVERTALKLDFGPGAVTGLMVLQGSEAIRAWEMLRAVCEFGDTDPPPSVAELNRRAAALAEAPGLEEDPFR